MPKTKRRRVAKAPEGEPTPTRVVLNDDNLTENQADRMNEIRTAADAFNNAIIKHMPPELANDLRHEVDDIVDEIQGDIHEEPETRKPAPVEDKEPVVASE